MNREEETIYYNDLFDIYGNLLTEREKEIFHLYYKEDLSLGEIASFLKVSKSAIGKSVGILNKKLEEYENKVKFKQKIKEIKTLCPSLREKIDNILNK